MSKATTENLISGKHLVRSTLWSLTGQIAPGLVAIVVLPYLIHGFGTDRFGVLSIAWMVVGYFSLFDLGTGRALTKLVADMLSIGRRDTLNQLIWTALAIMLVLGIAATLVVALLSRWLVFDILNIPEAIQQESLGAFHLLALSLPFVITSTGLRGVLEALHRFDLVNLVRIPQGILSFLAPLFVLPFSKSLVWMVASIILVRVLNWAVFLVLCLRQVPELRHRFAFSLPESGPLFRMGGWMTISNIAAALVLNLDRFIIGSILSVTAVAYYATPFDLLVRLALVPGALSLVLFPAFAMTLNQDRSLAAHRLRQGNKFTFVVLFPTIYFLVLFAPELMRVWLGPEFAIHSAPVARLIGFGVLLMSLAHIPVVMMQAAGRSDFTAKVHLFELPLYVAALWFLTNSMGLPGAAIAFLGRSALDCFLTLYGCERIGNRGVLLESFYAVSFAAAVVVASVFVPGMGARLLIYTSVLVVFIIVVLRKGFSVAERELLFGRFRTLAGS